MAIMCKGKISSNREIMKMGGSNCSSMGIMCKGKISSNSNNSGIMAMEGNCSSTGIMCNDKISSSNSMGMDVYLKTGERSHLALV